MIIEAKKDKLFIKMKKLSIKHWNLDVDNRIANNKFFENPEKLLKVGNEIFDNFGLKNSNIKLFADICSAPGMYSKIILDTFNKTTGIGISLPIEEGGVKFILKNPRYKIYYKNILDKEYKLELKKSLKLDMGMASCVSYELNAENMFFLNIELIIKSLMLILPNLKTEGTLIINMTMKNIELVFNIINILSKLFDKYKLWKSSTIWTTKYTFYFFGYGFKNNYNKNILNNILNNIKNKNAPINNNFLGTLDEYNNIYYKMKSIYIIRIKAWEKLINNKKN